MHKLNIDMTTINPSTGVIDLSTAAPHDTDNGGIADFLHGHIWVPILAAFSLLMVMGAVATLVVYRCRRSRHYDYTALHKDLALPSKMELQRHEELDAVRDAALLNCSFYLRSSGKYHLIDHLPEIGSRLSKHWFLVRTNNKAEKLLTMVPHSAHMALPFSNATKKTLRELLLQLEHPYIFPFDEIDFTMEEEQVVIVQPFCPTGSLKDFIYRSHPCDPWVGKYSYHAVGLSVKQIQQFGCQILQGLLFLEEQGYPVYGHLHTGNVILQKDTCQLSGYENILLGLSSKMESILWRHLKDNTGIIDTLCFGHMLFEMASGYELDAPYLKSEHWKSIQNPQVAQILKFIFENPAGYPSVQEIAENDFFMEASVAELQTFVPKPVYVSPATKNLFKMIKKQYPKKSKKKRDSVSSIPSEIASVMLPISRKQSFKSDKAKSKHGKGDKRKKSSKLKVQSNRALGASKEDERNEDVPTTTLDISPERSALLSHIRKGITLKPVTKPAKM